MFWKNPFLLDQGWMQAKLGFAVCLIGYQFFSGITRRKFAQGNFFLSEKACRMISEVPTILLVVIVLLTILKPSI